MKSLPKILRIYMKPYWWVAFIGFFTVILPTSMELVIPRMLQYIIDQGIRPGNMDAIWYGAGIMLGAALTGALATVGQGFCRAYISQGIGYDLRFAVFSHIQSFSFGNLNTMRTGQLMTYISSDVNQVRMFAGASMWLLLRLFTAITGSMVMIFLTDLKLAMIAMIFVGCAIILVWNFMRIARPLFERVQKSLDALNTLVQENFAGVQVIKAFVRERFAVKQFEGANVSYLEENIVVGRLLAWVSPVLMVITNVGTVAILWIGGTDVIGERITVGQLVAFNNYLIIGLGPMLFLATMINMVARADASAGRVLNVLATKPLIVQPDNPHSLGDGQPMQGRVTFEQVFFDYQALPEVHLAQQKNKSEEVVLEDISLTIEPGERVAIMGATGAGKSSLVNLVPRFYDVTGGAVSIDGVDVRQWDLDDLRKQIGVVLQQSVLFYGTIHENIAYGRPNATMDEVIEAAKAAQAHDFIMQKPEGYDSHIESRGTNLSGGQRQRLAIARAMLLKPSILILDDSTSAVDMETEVKIQEALDRLMADCTTFIVAQRISSVINADKIVILERGRLADVGTHRELLARSPIYQEIYYSQIGYSTTEEAQPS
ncbi:MAG: ABC transporter ATP-binding protein [Chloroflexota bacterium]